MSQETYIGVLDDPRSDAEKAKDWHSQEIASAESMLPKFRKVKEGNWERYTIRDQDGSGSCVAQTLAKMFEVIRKKNKGDTIVFSATPFFTRRTNKPSSGMYPAEALNIAVKHGTCRESAVKSQLMNDVQMDAIVLPENFEQINNDVDAVASLVCPIDFDYVAAAVEKWGALMLHITADYQSWGKDYPQLGSKNRNVSHCIAIVDAFTLNEVQYLLIEDSWGKFGKFKGQRLLSREVFNDMTKFVGALVSFEFDVIDEVKKYGVFKTIVEFGQTSNEVKRIQELLRDKGYFPSNQECTGYFGNVTAKAVYKFQVENNVASLAELNLLKGRRTGAKTLIKFNELYS